ncbi:MAG: glycosyltransferase [Acidobacteriota bacterium]|nr:glycosyltransferase [Acidobacteriota bacterium]
MLAPRILILTTSHGASHRRASEALKKAFLSVDPQSAVEITDAVKLCSRWFRAYYNSYLIPLRYFPGLWRRIERRQHQGSSTNPLWIYRLGARGLFRSIDRFAPDIVVATEVGIGEMAALHKRRAKSSYFLAGLELMDFNRAWVQPEIDLYPVAHPDLGEELILAGAPGSRVVDCGMPIDPVYSSLPDRASTRGALGLRENTPVLLVLFGGSGFGNARRMAAELLKLRVPVQVVFVTGKNQSLEKEITNYMGSAARRAAGPDWKVMGWVNNMHEWMTAADLLLSKPGGGTVMEAAACGLPLLAFDPLPGNEERTCEWLEKWRVGLRIATAEDIASVAGRLLTNPEELNALRERARSIARPHAARDAAEAILSRASSRASLLGRGNNPKPPR